MRVGGTGQFNPIVFLGDGPSELDQVTGIPFHPMSPGGRELNRYLNGEGLPFRDEVYTTLLVKEWLDPTKKKQVVTELEIVKDEWELDAELLAIKPKIIVTLGTQAARWCFDYDVDLDAVHGLLFRSSEFTGHKLYDGYDPYILPCYSPAAGLARPDIAARVAYDLEQLREMLTGEDLEHRVWKRAKPHNEYLDNCVWLADTVFALDTEGTPAAPFCYSASGYAGGATVNAPTPNMIQYLRERIGYTNKVLLHYATWDLQVLDAMKVHIPDDQFDDTNLMAYLLGLEPHGLKALALRHLGMELSDFEEIAGTEIQEYTKTGKPKKKKTKIILPLEKVEHKKMVNYAGEDADATFQLAPILKARIHAAGLSEIYEIDRRCLPIYARMEQVGMPLDPEHFATFKTSLEEELEIRTHILQMEYPDLNPGSPDQVAEIMYEHLKIPGGKKTASGKRFSTNDKILQALADAHPFVQAIIDWREVAKLKGTFVDNLPSYCRPAGDGSGVRLHYRLLPTRVVSGRLAAKDPNVLALPKHSDLGKRFRAGFRTIDHRRFGSWDLNQVELRVLALDSASDTLRTLFNEGGDVHARTAEKIFGVAPSLQDGSLHRLPAKAVNFGIPMGMTERGLAEQMRKNKYAWPELQGVKFHSPKKLLEAQAEVCQTWIQTTIADWGIGPYLESKVQQARDYGFVTDRWGRRRYLASVLSPNKMTRLEAERMAQSFPIQAGARGFYKQIIVRVWREVILPMKKEGYYVEPILDIHDDLLLEFDVTLSEFMQTVVTDIFDKTFTGLAVPITCKGKISQNWS
jgi:uracil-DNA glycosylase family 4